MREKKKKKLQENMSVGPQEKRKIKAQALILCINI